MDELVIKRRWYGDRDDFAVVVQDTPFITGPSSVSVSSLEPFGIPLFIGTGGKDVFIDHNWL